MGFNEIFSKLPAENAAWTGLFSSFRANTLLRINFMLKSQGKFFFVEEIDLARGPYTSWLYAVDEWSCLSFCTGPDFNIFNCFGNPPDMRNVAEICMDRLSFDLNSSFINDLLQDLLFSPHHVRREQSGIEMVNTFILFDFGDNMLKTEILEHLYKRSTWMELPYSGSFPLYESETLMKSIS